MQTSRENDSARIETTVSACRERGAERRHAERSLDLANNSGGATWHRDEKRRKYMYEEGLQCDNTDRDDSDEHAGRGSRVRGRDARGWMADDVVQLFERVVLSVREQVWTEMLDLDDAFQAQEPHRDLITAASARSRCVYARLLLGHATGVIGLAWLADLDE